MFTLIDALERKPKGKPDMSPHAVNNFVSDLVLMAQAMEKLPQVQEQLDASQTEVSEWKSRYDLQALDLEQARQNNAALEQRLHDAEVAKDAAETMFLEADERTSRALDFIKATFGNAGTLIQALEPPKVEQTVQNEGHGAPIAGNGNGDPQPEPVVSEVKPIEPDSPALVGASFDDGGPYNETLPSQGQSEPGPTVSESLQDSSQTATTVQEPDGAMASPGPYSGKRYFDHPTYVPLDAWLAGGGTEADYHWRPSHDYGKAFPF